MKYDLVATLGTYEKDGQKKYISRTVGMLMHSEKGLDIKLDASFNPAGCVRREDGSVWLKAFEQKARDGAKLQPSFAASDDFSQDMPF